MEEASSAEDFKNQGNEAFKANRFHEASEMYTKAIGMNCQFLLSVLNLAFIRTALPR